MEIKFSQRKLELYIKFSKDEWMTFLLHPSGVATAWWGEHPERIKGITYKDFNSFIQKNNYDQSLIYSMIKVLFRH
jgi:hypothetical protein